MGSQVMIPHLPHIEPYQLLYLYPSYTVNVQYVCHCFKLCRGEKVGYCVSWYAGWRKGKRKGGTGRNAVWSEEGGSVKGQSTEWLNVQYRAQYASRDEKLCVQRKRGVPTSPSFTSLAKSDEIAAKAVTVFANKSWFLSFLSACCFANGGSVNKNWILIGSNQSVHLRAMSIVNHSTK